MPMSSTIRRSIAAAVLSVSALLLPLSPAHAADYTDLWVTPGEDAWGVNFVQWDSLIYATFFIYGPDKKPTWYGAVMSRDGSGNFAGTLYVNQGTYFALPWNPADIAGPPAGTASFRPSTTNSYQGTLVYTVNGIVTITKSVQRFNDHPAIPLAGSYYGGENIAYTACTNSANNANFTDSFPLTVTQSASALTLVFAFEGLGATCTMSGALAQNGLLYSVPSASYTCTDGLSTTAAISNVKQTAIGIEGQFSAPGTNGDNCLESTRFSAVRQ
jgi:hypothetical protein